MPVIVMDVQLYKVDRFIISFTLWAGYIVRFRSAFPLALDLASCLDPSAVYHSPVYLIAP